MAHKSTEMYAVLDLIFDNDFDVSIITDMLGVKPKRAKNKKDSGFIKANGEKRAGIWSYYSSCSPSGELYKPCNSYSQLIVDMFASFVDKIETLRDLVYANGGIIRITTYICHLTNETDMSIENTAKKIIYTLNADQYFTFDN